MTEIKRQVVDYRPGETNTTVILENVAIIDAMADVQALFDELTKAFVLRIEKILESYSEGKVIFDRYDVEDSLKSKTRSKRVSQPPIEYDIHKHMTLKHISMKDLLSSNKNKSYLTHEFGETIINKIDKSYIQANQIIQSRENSGWQKTKESFMPTMSLSLPAPKAILELVRCGSELKLLRRFP